MSDITVVLTEDEFQDVLYGLSIADHEGLLSEERVQSLSHKLLDAKDGI